MCRQVRNRARAESPSTGVGAIYGTKIAVDGDLPIHGYKVAQIASQRHRTPCGGGQSMTVPKSIDKRELIPNKEEFDAYAFGGAEA